VFALVILLIAGAVAFALTRPEKVVVPNVVGKSSAAAAAVLHNAGFDVSIERVPDAETPVDAVIRQDPQANNRADKGSTVALTVSSGPGQRGVPNVLGDGRLAATRQLRKDGFKVRERREASDEVPENHVIDTTPGPGTLTEVGTTVTLTVSSGRKRIAVPEVTDLSSDDARSRLEDAGLQVNVQQRDSDRDPGTVLQQDPPAGTKVVQGTTVTIFVARAPETVEVPDVTNLPEGDAVNAVSDAHLSPRTRDRTVTNPDQVGVVVHQNPSGNRKVKRGSAVTLTIGRAPTSTTPSPGAGDETQTTPPPGGGAGAPGG
jgi:eukaryotic-like serine/threonine-protein kinase